MAPTQTPVPTAAQVRLMRDVFVSWGVKPRDHMTLAAFTCLKHQEDDLLWATDRNSPLHHDNNCPWHGRNR